MDDKSRQKVSEIMTRDVVAILDYESVLAATQKMAEHGISSIVALNSSGKLSGLLTESDILDRVTKMKRDPQATFVRDVMIKDVFTMPPNTLVSHAAGIIRGNNFEIIPVMEGDRMLGVVSKTDLSNVINSISYFRKVKDIMTPEVVFAEAGDLVSDVVNIMGNKNISSVVVMDKGKLVGIFTEKDLFTRIISKSKDPSKTPVRDVMTSPVITINPETSINEAKKIQRSVRLRILPVIEQDRVVGIVSETDILKASESVKFEFNALGEVAACAVEATAAAVSKVIEKDASIEISSLDCISLKMVFDLLGLRSNEIAGIYLDMEGDLNGRLVLLFSETTAYSFMDEVNSKSEGISHGIPEEDESRFKKVGNAYITSYMEALSARLGFKVTHSEPFYQYDTLGSVMDGMASLQERTSDYALITKTICRIEEKEYPGLFVFLLTQESLEKMAAKLIK